MALCDSTDCCCLSVQTVETGLFDDVVDGRAADSVMLGLMADCPEVALI